MQRLLQGARSAGRLTALYNSACVWWPLVQYSACLVYKQRSQVQSSSPVQSSPVLYVCWGVGGERGGGGRFLQMI